MTITTELSTLNWLDPNHSKNEIDFSQERITAINGNKILNETIKNVLSQFKQFNLSLSSQDSRQFLIQRCFDDLQKVIEKQYVYNPIIVFSLQEPLKNFLSIQDLKKVIKKLKFPSAIIENYDWQSPLLPSLLELKLIKFQKNSNKR